MIKQLDEVVSGKYKPKKLSNPVRFLAQKYVDNIARESTLAPEKRRLLHTHLYQFTKKIPWYMKDNKPVVENTKDDVKLQTSMKKMKSLNKKLLTQVLSPRKLRSKTELKSPVKTEVGVKRGKKAQDLKYPRKSQGRKSNGRINWIRG